MLKKLVVLLALATATVGYAQQWIDVSKTQSYLFSIQAGSLRYITTDAKKPVIAVVGRITDLKTTQADPVIWYVSVADCLGNRGKLVATDISGKFLNDYDFVYGLGSAGSVIAESICRAGLETSERKEKTVPRNNI